MHDCYYHKHLLTHDCDVGTRPDSLVARRGSNLTLVLALILKCSASNDQVVLADGLVAHVLVARIAGNRAVKACMCEKK